MPFYINLAIYIQDKLSCDTWNGDVAAVGIQNDASDTAFVPPGRSTSDSPWITTNFVFEWPR